MRWASRRSARRPALTWEWTGRMGPAAILSAGGLISWAMVADDYYSVSAGMRAPTGAAVASARSCALPGEGLPRAGPAYLESVPLDHGRTLVRITDPLEGVPGLPLRWGPIARHHYSLDQPWNADKSLLMLDRGTSGQLFVDGSSYKPLFVRKAPGEVRWHPREPNLQILVSGASLGLWDVRADRIIRVAEFQGYSELAFGPNKGNPSDDGRMVALLAQNPSGRRVVFAYDLETRRKFPDIDLTGKEVSYATISPSGRYIVVRGKLWPEVQPKGDQTEILDLSGRKVGAWPEYGRPSHFDLGFDQSGEEVAVGVSKSPPEQWQIIKRRLRDGAVIPLSAPGGATHVSLRNVGMPGWAFVTYAERPDREGWLPYSREIVALKLDGSREAVPVARTESTGKPYEAEAHAVAAPDGCQVVFASDWGQQGGEISAYVADSPICAVRNAAVPPAPQDGVDE